jgi:hypothetical protein
MWRGESRFHLLNPFPLLHVTLHSGEKGLNKITVLLYTSEKLVAGPAGKCSVARENNGKFTDMNTTTSI